MKTRKIWLFSTLFCLLIVLTACADDGEPEEAASDDDGDNASAAQSGGDLTIAAGADVVTLSAHGQNDVPSHNVEVNIYETLTTLNENQEPQPGLAKDWEEVDDTTWDFHLREGIKFHDGEKLDAEAVKANFDRLMDEKIGSSRKFIFDAVKNVEVQDDYTVRINLKYPYAPLLTNLSHAGAGIMSPKIIEKDYAQMEEGGDVAAYINKHPVGTGPFKFEKWVPGDKVVLKRNEDYWGENAKLDSVTFKVVSEQSTRIAELETDKSDVVNKIGPNNISRVENMPNAGVLKQQSMSLEYLGFNMEKEPFDDKRVRQAISMAINKKEINDGVYNGVGLPAKGPMAPPVFGYDDSIEGLGNDPEKAKELLAEAGYEDGFKTTIWTNEKEQRVDMAVAVQSQLSDIGIEVEVKEMEWGAYLERTANGDHDMFILGWSTSTGDADQALYPLFHSSKVGDPGNRSFLKNDKVDELLDQGRRATETDKRKAIYSDVQEKLVDLAPVVYMNHNKYLVGVDDSVKNFDIDAGGIYQIKNTYIEE